MSLNGPMHLLTNAIRRWEQHAMEDELRNSSDRELHDIGITRGDIDRLFDPAFAAEFGRRGETLPTLRRNAGGW